MKYRYNNVPLLLGKSFSFDKKKRNSKYEHLFFVLLFDKKRFFMCFAFFVQTMNE
jgi:hypothetical protein